MKKAKILILLVPVVLSGCRNLTSPIIVESVHEATYFNSKKYYVTISGDIRIETDSLYNVGDTLIK